MFKKHTLYKGRETENSPLKTSLNSPGGAWMTKLAAMRTCRQKQGTD